MVVSVLLRHSCGFACQQRVLKMFPGPGYLYSEDGVDWLSIHLSIYLSIYLSICLCIYLSIYIHIHTYIYIYTYNIIYMYIYVYTTFRDLGTNLHKSAVLGTTILIIKVNTHMHEVFLTNSLIFLLKIGIHCFDLV